MVEDDLRQRIAAISIPEFRRKVDIAIEYVREMRRSFAVHAGMTLEQAPGPIPELLPEQAERTFQEIIEMLPLIREPRSPEARARRAPLTERDREQMKAVLEEMAAHPEAIDELARKGDLDLSSKQVLELRDEMVKVEMLGELKREVAAFQEELLSFQQRQIELAEALIKQISARRGQG